MHSRRPAASVFKLEQSFVQLLHAAEELASLAELTGVLELMAARDQGRHLGRRLDVKPKAFLDIKGPRDRLGKASRLHSMIRDSFKCLTANPHRLSVSTPSREISSN
jgi:hypothetical protein